VEKIVVKEVPIYVDKVGHLNLLAIFRMAQWLRCPSCVFPPHDRLIRVNPNPSIRLKVVYQDVIVEVERIVKTEVEKIVEVVRHVDREVLVEVVREIPIDKIVEIEVERVVEVPVPYEVVKEVPVERIVEIPVERIVTKEVEVIKEIEVIKELEVFKTDKNEVARQASGMKALSDEIAELKRQLAAKDKVVRTY